MGPSRDDPGPVAEPPLGLRSYAEQLRDTIAFAVERIPYYRDRAEPVSYTHLTLPTNREV